MLLERAQLDHGRLWIERTLKPDAKIHQLDWSSATCFHHYQWSNVNCWVQVAKAGLWQLQSEPDRWSQVGEKVLIVVMCCRQITQSKHIYCVKKQSSVVFVIAFIGWLFPLSSGCKKWLMHMLTLHRHSVLDNSLVNSLVNSKAVQWLQYVKDIQRLRLIRLFKFSLRHADSLFKYRHEQSHKDQHQRHKGAMQLRWQRQSPRSLMCVEATEVEMESKSHQCIQARSNTLVAITC